MTAEPPESPVTEAVRSLEVRWIFPGQLETAVAGWFGRFPARTESREDIYLLDPQLPGLSVKVRGSGALEVKAYRTGGPWDSRRPARPVCSAGNSRPPPRSCSPRPCPVVWNPARRTPGPTRSGCPTGRAPAATPAPEVRLSAGPAGPPFRPPRPAPAQQGTPEAILPPPTTSRLSGRRCQCMAEAKHSAWLAVVHAAGPGPRGAVRQEIAARPSTPATPDTARVAPVST
jgi:hypothetical protein